MTETSDPYEITRQIILMVRIAGEESAPVCAQMLSDVNRAERNGDPCPGYVELLERTKAEVG